MAESLESAKKVRQEGLKADKETKAQKDTVRAENEVFKTLRTERMLLLKGASVRRHSTIISKMNEIQQ